MGAHQCLGAPEIEKRQRCVIVASGVGVPGFEPGKAGPESAVLPLHHTPINKDVRDALSNTTAKVHTFLFSPKGKAAFFAFHRKKTPQKSPLSTLLLQISTTKEKKNMLQPANWDTFSFSLLEVQPSRDSALLKIFIEDCKPRTSHSPDLLQALRSSSSRKHYPDWTKDLLLSYRAFGGDGLT